MVFKMCLIFIGLLMYLLFCVNFECINLLVILILSVLFVVGVGFVVMEVCGNFVMMVCLIVVVKCR